MEPDDFRWWVVDRVEDAADAAFPAFGDEIRDGFPDTQIELAGWDIPAERILESVKEDRA